MIAAALTSCSGSAWSRVIESDVNFSHNVSGFINEGLGITGGYAGEVHYTIDGGKSWPEGEKKTLCRYAIDALPGGELIHAGNQGVVGISTDGRSWTKLETPIDGMAMLVNFFDRARGCTVDAKNNILLTEDGGSSWRRLNGPKIAGIIIAIEHFSEQGICIIDSQGNFYMTQNLGSSWTTSPLPCRENGIDTARLSGNSASMRFTDAMNGNIAVIALVGGSDKSRIVVLKTTDGAKSFTAEKISCRVNSSTELFLSPDSMYLTANGDNKIELFKNTAGVVK